MAEKTKKFVLVRGKHFDKNGQSVKIGSTVELNESQANAFKDMFEPLSVAKARLAALNAVDEAADENKGTNDADDSNSDGSDNNKPDTASGATDAPGKTGVAPTKSN